MQGRRFSRLFACCQPDVCCEWPTFLKDAAHFPTMEAVASCASTFLESPTFAATTSLLIDWKEYFNFVFCVFRNEFLLRSHDILRDKP